MTKWNLKVSRDVLQGSRTEHIPVLSGICSAWTSRIHKFWSMFLVSGSSHHTDGPQGRTEVPDWFVNSVRFNGDFSLGISRVLLVCCGPWGRKESDTNWWLNNKNTPQGLSEYMGRPTSFSGSWKELDCLPEFVTVSGRCSINPYVLMTAAFVDLSCPLFNVSGTNSIFLLTESWGINHLLHSLILSYIQRAYWVTLVFQRQSQAIGNISYKHLFSLS